MQETAEQYQKRMCQFRGRARPAEAAGGGSGEAGESY